MLRKGVQRLMLPKDRIEICEFILMMKRHENFAEQLGFYNRTIISPESEVDSSKKQLKQN